MTGGLVVILGETGRNFGAGMSGGVAYIWDKKGDFAPKLNGEMVAIEALTVEDENILKMYVEQHLQYTDSDTAKAVLDNWATALPQFVKVMPQDFKKALASRNISVAEVLENKDVVYKDIQVEIAH
jgi:glutamate synthase (NADPH/NADH) large chain